MVSKEETSFLPQSLLKERQMMGPGHTFKKTNLWILSYIAVLLEHDPYIQNPEDLRYRLVFKIHGPGQRY